MSVAHTAGHLLLILLLTEARKTLGNAHSLCLDLTIKSQSRPGQPWCQVQGSVDTKPFLQYDSDSNKVKPLGFLGKEVNDTKVWTELSQTLAEAGKELKMVLPVIKLDKKEMRGPPTLQVKMCCQREAEQCSGASLHFSLNGRTALLLDTMSVTWTVIDPGATSIKEEWENNQELAEYFRKISTGDCSYLLREFLKHWENMLLPEPTASPTMVPPTEQPMAPAISPITWIAPGVLAIFVIMGIVACILYKKRRRCSQEAPDRGSVGLRTQSLLGCLTSPAFTLVPGEQTLGIPSLSISYNDTVAAPSGVSCPI
uniref:Uncharacterized protein n=1 Tax=Ovis aries TaxID=9940 RepID=A0AC11DW23_SHEEP